MLTMENFTLLVLAMNCVMLFNHAFTYALSFSDYMMGKAVDRVSKRISSEHSARYFVRHKAVLYLMLFGANIAALADRL